MRKSILFLSFIYFMNAQSQNRTEMAAYNVGLGSVFGGIGAIINKEPEEKTGKVFLKGLWQGAVGGYLIYESKNIISKIPEKEKWEYSWAAKFVNAAGTSIVENAASNRDLWEQWHFHIGFNRIELYTKDQFKIKYKVLPISLILTGITASKTKFEAKRTLQTGELIFSDPNLRTDRSWRAYVLGNVMVIDNSVFDDYFVFGHEVIHIYQYYDYNFINTYTNPFKKRWSENSNTFNTFNNYFYLDIQGPILTGLKRLSGNGGNCHFDNFFEYEAEFFAQKGRVICP